MRANLRHGSTPSHEMASSKDAQGARPFRVRGFTLIELLVVIAIIGILSAVVLASMNVARTRGGDAAVKANLETVRTQAGLYYDSHANKYSTVAVLGADCGTTFPAGTMLADPVIKRALSAAYKANGNAVFQCNMDAAGTSYAIVAPLATAGTYWCVDSMSVAQSYVSGVSALDSDTDYTCN